MHAMDEGTLHRLSCTAKLNSMCIKFYTAGFVNYFSQVCPNTFTHATMLWRREVPAGEPDGLLPTPKAYGMKLCSIRSYEGRLQLPALDEQGRILMTFVSYLVWTGQRG